MVQSDVLYRRLLARVRLRHLQAMVTVAELGSVKRAAEAIGLTQPATTLVIAELEKLLECALFYRHGRGMRLSSMGLELLPFAQRTLLLLEEGVDRLALSHSLAQQRARVAAIEGAINGLLARALPAFVRLRPDISVELEEANAAQVSALISGREIDLLLCRQPTVLPEDWEFSVLMPDRLVVVAGPEHPLARNGCLSIADLSEETWLLLPASTESRRQFDELVRRNGSDTSTFRQLKTRSFTVIQAMLQSERLVLLTPLSVMRQRLDSGQLTMLDYEASLPLRPIGILNPIQKSGEAAMELKTFLLEFAQRFP